jgi:WD40 repeat protein
VTGGLDSLVNVWQLNTHELHSTMEGHSAAVTAVAISPNGLFTISGSEDKTARVWGLTLGLVVSIFKASHCIFFLFFFRGSTNLGDIK